MKKLTRDQMKKVFGGDEAVSEFSDGSGSCPSACAKAGSNGSVKSGTCSKSSITVNHVTFDSCACSITGGSGC